MAGNDMRIGVAGLSIGGMGADAGQAARSADVGAFDSLLKRLESAKDGGARAALSAERPAAQGASANQSMPEVQFASTIKDPTPRSSSPSQKPVIDKTDKLYEQCEALESFLIKNLLNGMRATVQKSGFMDEGFAGKMYEDMLYDEYAKDFTKNAGLGFAEMAYLELSGQRGKVINDKF